MYVFTLLLLVILILVVLAIVPPILFAKEVFKYFRNAGTAFTLFVAIVAVLISLIPLGLNMLYLASVTPELIEGQFNPDRMLVFALLVSWASIWGRMFVRKLRSRRRRQTQ